MNFSSPLFLFLFLPAVLGVHQLLPNLKARNTWLAFVSLIFYAWGEVGFVLLLVASTLMNYALGLWVDRSETSSRRKAAVAVAVILNLGLLAVFKYINLSVDLLNSILSWFGTRPISLARIPLPIGISFFTFH